MRMVYRAGLRFRRLRPVLAAWLTATPVIGLPAAGVGQESGTGTLSVAAAVGGELEMDRRFGYPALPVEELARLGITDVQTRAGVVSAMVGRVSLELYVGSPFYRYGAVVRPLPNAPYYADGRYWIPASLVTGGGGLGASSSGQLPAPLARTGAEPGEAAPAGGAPADPPARGALVRPLRVVLDPGHGGRDPGTTGRRGTREKDIVLAIAKMVHADLTRMDGVEPILTRDRDVLIPLRRRSQLAVAQRADLFVSIHANASKDRKAQGFETYFLGEARTELSREVAMRENSAVRYEEESDATRPEDLQVILARLNLASFQRESSSLGGYVQNSLRSALRSPDRGVKQNVFWVLVGSTGSMPSILVEIGFLSNDEEERLLRSEAGRRRVADAIVAAIVAYRDDYAPRLQAAGAR